VTCQKALGEKPFPGPFQLSAFLGSRLSITPICASTIISLSLPLLPPSFPDKDLCDYIEPIQIIQDNLKNLNYTCKVLFAVLDNEFTVSKTWMWTYSKPLFHPAQML
jgi:hypothetical protein